MNYRMLLASLVPSIGLWAAICWALVRLHILPAGFLIGSLR